MSIRSRCARHLVSPAIIASSLACSAAHALTFNPIDPSSLSVSIHARASCSNGTVSYPGNVGSITPIVSDHAVSASCGGSVTQENPATLAGVAGTSSAAANAKTGTLRAVAAGRSIADDDQALRAGASASAYLYDTLTVNGNWTGTRTIELRLAVHGTLTSNAIHPNWQSSNVSSVLWILSEPGATLGNSGLIITQGNSGEPFITSFLTGVVDLTTNAVNTVFDPNDVQFAYSYFFPATTENRTFSFMGRLSITAAMGFGTGLETVAEGLIDFGNTGQFSLIVPNDVTVTSASGQFLAAVPEPETYAMFLAGLAAVLGRIGWKRRKQARLAHL